MVKKQQPDNSPEPNSAGASLEGVVAVLLALGSLLVVTCGGGQASPQTPPDTTATSGQSDVLKTQAVTEPGATGEQQPASGAPPKAVPTANGPLARFWAQIQELTEHRRDDHVRVLWLGDSHTAADFWVHPLRMGLGRLARPGGPGYLQVGSGMYRHGAARVESVGHWRTVPAAPSYFVKTQGDGRYGLGGFFTVPKDTKAMATLRVEKGALAGNARWQVIYRLPNASSRFTVQVDPGETRQVVAGVGQALESGLFSLELESAPDAALHIRQAQDNPEIFGVIVEGTAPGVLIDTLGINGARVATTLTWSEPHFVAEVKRRNPALVILAYGSNEIGDALAPWRYTAQYEALLGRLRAAVPQVACLILGPTDRALPDWTTNPRTLEIDQVQRELATKQGCEFFSMVEAMGGAGSLQRWAFVSPPLARKDRVHLTAQGYTTLGEALARHLLAAHSAARP